MKYEYPRLTSRQSRILNRLMSMDEDTIHRLLDQIDITQTEYAVEIEAEEMNYQDVFLTVMQELRLPA